MEKIIYNILNKIESLGYEAYIVGGYVRDFLLNKPSYDIDIASSATLDTLTSLFLIQEAFTNLSLSRSTRAPAVLIFSSLKS